MQLSDIPQELLDEIGGMVLPEDIPTFWRASHEMFGGKSPQQVWAEGRRDDVLNFIKATQSGDPT